MTAYDQGRAGDHEESNIEPEKIKVQKLNKVMEEVFRILKEDDGYQLYYATGTKNFVRDFKRDESKLIRYLRFNKIMLDEKSLRMIETFIFHMV